MKRFNKFLSTAVLSALLALPLSGCLEEAKGQPTQREQQASVARRAAESVQFVDNAEIENIKRRIELTANPGTMGYIVLFNESGVPIMYETVKGKITTSGSRLTPPDQIVRRPGGQSADSQAVIRAPSDTGTYDTGTARFIYYWTQAGEYRQWSGHYLYSTTPIRLRVEPMVVNVASVPAGR